MEYNSVALLGAGAVGAFFTAGLTETLGSSFCLIAEGERKARLEAAGLCVNGKHYAPRVCTPAEAGTPDVILIAVKYPALREALAAIRGNVGENTLVLPVLNGIDSEEIAAEYVGEEHVFPSFMRIVAHRRGDCTDFDPAITDGLVFGERSGERSERVDALDRLFTRCGLAHKVSAHILAAQWNKFGINIANNLVQAVLGVGFGAYYDSEHVAALRAALIREVTAVAAAEGTELRRILSPADAALPGAHLSTLQDLDAGRTTEVDMFLGVLMERAARHGISVPFSEYTYHAIKALEEKNAGRFDY